MQRVLILTRRRVLMMLGVVALPELLLHLQEVVDRPPPIEPLLVGGWLRPGEVRQLALLLVKGHRAG